MAQVTQLSTMGTPGRVLAFLAKIAPATLFSGPYCVQRAAIYLHGSESANIYQLGSEAANVYRIGSELAGVYQHGTERSHIYKHGAEAANVSCE